MGMKTADPPAPPRPIRAAPPTRRRRSKPRIQASNTGLIFCFVTALLGIAAQNGQANLLFGVFGLMIGVILVSGVICVMVFRNLRVTRLLPELCTVGRPSTLIYHFKNQKIFWPSLSVTLAEVDSAPAFESQPLAYLLHAAARSQVSVAVDILPTRRGQHAMGRYQLSTSFPFGFFKRTLDRQEDDTLLVSPPLGHVSQQLLGMCRSDQRADSPVKPRRGGQDEFYGVKEHRPGENPRFIYWRRSARTPGILVSKELTQVAPPKLIVLVDTYYPKPELIDAAAIEKAVAMAASLAAQALDDGLSVGLCAWDGAAWIAIAPQQGKRQRRDILAALARLPRNTTADSTALLQAAEPLVKSGSSAVLFTPQSLQVSLNDRLRGALVVVPALSLAAQSWFTFDPKIDFSKCVPLEDQIPPLTTNN